MSKTSLSAVGVRELASTPTTPDAGDQLIYPKSDGKWYVKNSAGVEIEVVRGNDSRLTDARTPTAHTHTLADLPDDWTKRSVRVTTITAVGNTTLSGTQTIDSVALVVGDRILVKDQTTSSQNGIYIVAAGAWSRATDMDSSDDVSGAVVAVDQGTQGGQLWTTSFRRTDTVGTTAMLWYRVVDSSMVAVASGVASLDSGTKVPLAQLPVATSGTSNSTQVVRADDSRLSDSRTPSAHTVESHSNVLSSAPTAGDGFIFESGSWNHRPLVKGDVGLGNVDNTSDANKPISTATQTALNGKANSSHSHVATVDLTATGTKNSTTFLRGDDTWAVPSGGSSGATVQSTAPGSPTTGQLWYDTDEAPSGIVGESPMFSLTTDYTTSTPSTPTTGTRMFTRHRARRLPSFVGPSGQDSALQPALFSNRVARLAAINGTANFNNDSVGQAVAYTTAVANVNVTNTNFFTTMVRNRWATPATVNNFAGFRIAAAQWMLSSTANQGGFFWVNRFGVQAGTATMRGFTGLSATTSNEANSDPTSLLNRIGFGFNSTSSNWYFHSAGASTNATTVDLGANFPARTYATNFFEFRLFAPAGGGQTVYWSAQRLNDGAFVQGGPVTTNLPAVNTLLTHHSWLNNVTASIIALESQLVYIESDN